MKKNSKYDIEIENFRKQFSDMKEQRIAIYGMGRRTATLLPGIKDYKVVGLLDRDVCNIGKELCGIRVISIDNIEKVADVIIINSDPSNYEIIYGRIANDVSIPIYYADGQLAKKKEMDTKYQQNVYWSNSYDDLKRKIDMADIVSFDIFDTLVMRKLFSPEDVFRLLGELAKIRLGIQDDVSGNRATVASRCGACASLDEIYEKMQAELQLSDEALKQLKNMEKCIDISLCQPRQDIVELYEYSIATGKEVYLVSDMYYSTKDIKQILEHCKVMVLDDLHIWISSEQKCDKISGTLWEKYAGSLPQEKNYLHIGDNLKSDIENPLKYGINTYHVMSAKEMLKNSSAALIASHVNTVSDSLCLGLVLGKLFNSPFALSEKKGRILFEDDDIYGYCVYGPLMEKFLLWLYFNSRNDHIEKLQFFARDGYFLEKGYKTISELLQDGHTQTWGYLPISRRLIYLATIENEEDLERVIAFPYVGTFAEYMKARFEIDVDERTKKINNIMINAVGDKEQLSGWLQPYKESIMREAKKERINYIAYLTENKGNCLDVSYGIVDLGYYGTNQYYYQKIIGLKTQGYCFYCNLTDDNVYINDISMKGCFQYGKDLSAEESVAKKKNMFLETFLTAPHGMIRYIDEAGKIVCEADKKSQDFFSIKENINDASIQFITDYIEIYKEVLKGASKRYTGCMEERTETIEDVIFYQMLDGCSDVSKNILKGFYFDNDFVGGREVPLEM